MEISLDHVETDSGSESTSQSQKDDSFESSKSSLHEDHASPNTRLSQNDGLRKGIATLFARRDNSSNAENPRTLDSKLQESTFDRDIRSIGLFSPTSGILSSADSLVSRLTNTELPMKEYGENKNSLNVVTQAVFLQHVLDKECGQGLVVRGVNMIQMRKKLY
jgi:hypothetical protein